MLFCTLILSKLQVILVGLTSIPTTNQLTAETFIFCFFVVHNYFKQ